MGSGEGGERRPAAPWAGHAWPWGERARTPPGGAWLPGAAGARGGWRCLPHPARPSSCAARAAPPGPRVAGRCRRGGLRAGGGGGAGVPPPDGAGLRSLLHQTLRSQQGCWDGSCCRRCCCCCSYFEVNPCPPVVLPDERFLAPQLSLPWALTARTAGLGCHTVTSPPARRVLPSPFLPDTRISRDREV